jgi:TIR domain
MHVEMKPTRIPRRRLSSPAFCVSYFIIGREFLGDNPIGQHYIRTRPEGRTMTAKVFISYRRDDSAGYAGRVRDRLERELGRDLLFMDVDAIPLGTNFSKVLHEEVAKCGELLAIIGPNWPDARDEHGNRRLDDPNDFVRIEIAAALQRDIPVIPILLDGARIPKADQLPEDLKELALRNGMEIRHASFQDDMNRLIRGLKGHAGQAGVVDGVHIAGEGASEFPTKTRVAQSQLKGRDGLWGFLRDKRNQQVLSWLRGGLVVAATGFWAAFVYFFPAPKAPDAKSPEPTPPSVQANCGAIAIGGDVTGSTITAGTTTNLDCAPKPK